MSLSSQLRKALVIFIIFIAVASYFHFNKPQVRDRSPHKGPKFTVEILDIKARPFQIKIDSFGVVKPRTQTRMFPQVSGKVIKISDNFREGGFFEKGDPLIEVDHRDYETQLKVSEADYQSAIQQLEEEKARVKQAIDDWKRLGKSSKAPALVLRKPQLAAAKSRVAAAEAKLSQAKLNLQRTFIKAPYAGRVLTKSVDIGQFITPATALGEIYAIDYVEIRLPLPETALPFIDLPENSRDHSVKGSFQQVEFTSELGGIKQKWQGKIVRTEGAIDANTHQLYVIAQINDPYASSDPHVIPLKIGQYLEARIDGKNLQNAIVIPEKAVYQQQYVYLYKKGTVQKTTIDIAWSGEGQVVVKSGLASGDKLVTTLLGQIISGTRVKLKNNKDAVVNKKRQQGFSKKQHVNNGVNP